MSSSKQHFWEKTIKICEHAITILILLNAVVAGLLTSPKIVAFCGMPLKIFCNVSLLIFLIEISIRLLYHFKILRISYTPPAEMLQGNGWLWFDTIITIGSLFSFIPGIQGIRILREFRLFRSISRFPKMKTITEALLKSIPSIMWSGLFLIIVFYVYSIIGVDIYGNEFNNLFGDIGKAFFTLFQLTTLEGWNDIALTVMDKFPMAWVYFVSFIILSSFILLNLIVGVIVDCIAQEREIEAKNSNIVNDIQAYDNQVDNIQTDDIQVDDIQNIINQLEKLKNKLQNKE